MEPKVDMYYGTSRDLSGIIKYGDSEGLTTRKTVEGLRLSTICE